MPPRQGRHCNRFNRLLEAARDRATSIPCFAHLERRSKRGVSMTKDVYDPNPKRKPINRLTAIVVSRGERWKPRKQLYQSWFAWRDVPIPVLPYPVGSAGGQGMEIGFRAGRLVVVGYGGSSSDGAKWVVRCDCGAYGHQKARWLRSEAAKERAACPACDHLIELKSGRYFSSDGGAL